MDALQPKWFKAITAVMSVAAYLGSKNLIMDLQSTCGNWLDSDIIKSLTVFSLIYLRIEDIIVTTMITVGYWIVRKIAFTSPVVCKSEHVNDTPIFPFVG